MVTPSMTAAFSISRPSSVVTLMVIRSFTGGSQRANFDSLDPIVPGNALGNSAQLAREVWNYYQRNPIGVMTEAHRAYRKILGTGSP